LDGKAELKFEAEGLRATLSIPLKAELVCF
jgi:hypothetical protein